VFELLVVDLHAVVVSGLDKLLDQSQCVEYDMNQFLAELKE
jgi:hypothetical protein